MGWLRRYMADLADGAAQICTAAFWRDFRTFWTDRVSEWTR